MLNLIFAFLVALPIVFGKHSDVQDVFASNVSPSRFEASVHRSAYMWPWRERALIPQAAQDSLEIAEGEPQAIAEFPHRQAWISP